MDPGFHSRGDLVVLVLHIKHRARSLRRLRSMALLVIAGPWRVTCPALVLSEQQTLHALLVLVVVSPEAIVASLRITDMITLGITFCHCKAASSFLKLVFIRGQKRDGRFLEIS